MTLSLRPTCLVVLAVCLLGSAFPAQSQTRPLQRHVRTYVPPDQLVSFVPGTPFDQFVAFLNPIFERVSRKIVVDPEARNQPIGISIAGMHFMDAFELVLEYNKLTYRETDQYFIVQPVPSEQQVADARTPARGEAAPVPATAQTREIQIDALLFEMNLSRARETGINWNAFFGGGTGGSGSGTGGSGTGGTDQAPQFQVATERIFDPVSGVLIAPATIDVATLTNLLRYYETQGVGETVANPQVTVQSGQEGRIQIGSDIPIQMRDFAGNTVTQFISTGIIINVVPTLLSDEAGEAEGAVPMEFIHLDVQVEKSGGRPSFAGVVIDRSQANTQVLLLNNEQTIIGGLYSTEEIFSRRGVPVLKDLPGWFFGLRYLFGVTQRTTVQKELLIVLQARVVDSITVRAARPFPQDLRQRERFELRERLERVDPDAGRLPLPETRPAPQP